MRNKGAVWTLAVALTVVCGFQLFFTYKTAMIRKDARDYAINTNNDEQDYLDSISDEVVLNLGFKKYTFRECLEQELNFGLDLKGGMNLILEISTEDVLRSLSEDSQDSTFLKAIELAHDRKENTNKDFIALFGEAFEEINPDASMARIFSSSKILRDKIEYETENDEVLRIIREEAEGAIDNAFNIIRTRIDQFGVVQPNIQRLETRRDRILVDLPGVKDVSRVEKILQGTANLEFWETYTLSEVYNTLEAINDVTVEFHQEQASITTEEEKVDSTKMADSDIDAIDKILKGAEEKAAEADSVKEETEDINPFFNRFVMNAQQGRPTHSPVIGYARASDIDTINYFLELARERGAISREIKFLWSAKPYEYLDEGGNKRITPFYELYAAEITTREGKAPLDGDVITSASQEFDQNTGTAYVYMSMDGEGTDTWAALTKKNKGQFVAIAMDDRIYSAPVVKDEITNGISQISGNFTIEEAQDLSNLLKSGKLPAQANIVEKNVVGPSLGKRAVDAGFKSFAIAFLVILLYMIFYYSRSAGLVANIALILNMFFIIGVLASLQASLTLPGIAGIILTIGMSVDANVLIYERIREELAAGKGIKLAISDGYRNARSAILDANVTTFITGFILLIFGTGPIKGFATTLLIGICTSLFSAIFITRLVFEYYLTKKRDIAFATKLTQGAFKNLKIKFIEKRKGYYLLSSIIIGAGLISLFMRGLDSGVDFTGGRNYVIEFPKAVNSVEITEVLTSELGEIPKVIIFGEENQIRVTTTYKINEDNPAVDDELREKLYTALKPYLREETTLKQFAGNNIQSEQKVGPTIADDIKRQAVFAIVFALVFMFLYIIIRFRNWQFGLGAVLALIHDTLIVLGLFSILHGFMPFSLEIDQAFIAAILTVVGYSINDTVVVFDRIREFIREHPKWERLQILNTALNSTLSRTFSTSLSTFVVLLTIFMFGGEVIRGFTFALLVGVIVGTYSSLFIATPVVYDSVLKAETTRVLKGKKRR